MSILLWYVSIDCTRDKQTDTLRQKMPSDTQKVDSLLSLANHSLDDSPKDAIDYCRQARKRATTLNYKQGQALAEFYCGKIYRHSDQYQQALERQQAALTLFQELKNDSLIAKSRIETGLIYFAIPDIDKAIDQFNLAREIYEQVNDSTGIAVTLNNLGRCYRKSGDLDSALDNSLKSLEHDDDNNHNAYNTISIIYAMMGEPEIALEYQTKALRIREQLGLQNKVIGSLNNLGLIAARMGKHDKALSYLLESAQIAEKAGDKLELCRTLNNIGAFYENYFGNVEKALMYYRKALKVGEEIDEYFEKANILINIGGILSKMKQDHLALENFEMGITLAQKIGAKEIIQNGYEALTLHYERTGDYKNALESYKHYVAFKDSIFNQQTNDKIAEMQVKYETEKMEQENEIYKLKIEREKLLKSILLAGIFFFLVLTLVLVFLYRQKLRITKLLAQDITRREKIESELQLRVKQRTKALVNEIKERKKAEKQIKKELNEKEILIRELYHRTKNNMQVICSILRLKSMRLDDQSVQNLLKEIETRILSMALVHQKLISSQDLSHLSLKDYFDSLITLIKDNYLVSNNNISFHTKMENISVLIDTAVPFGLVFHELLSNVVKHAFPSPKKGVVNIQLYSTTGQEIVLEISDNGVGLPEEFDTKKDLNLGLETVFSLVERQLKGRIHFKNQSGLHYKIVLQIEGLYQKRVP